MIKDFLIQFKYFQRINVPRFVGARIQQTALKHLGLPDMGKLRDRMEGQRYYDLLRCDILAEYAFEKIIGNRNFDWEERDKKSYKRKYYVFDDKIINIISFSGDSFPKLKLETFENAVFIYVDDEFRVLVSGVASKSCIHSIVTNMNSSNKKVTKSIEIKDFSEFKSFSNFEELKALLD